MFFFLFYFLIFRRIQEFQAMEDNEMKKWTRAAWLEKGKPYEGVVPSKWVIEDQIWWPHGRDVSKQVEEMREPLATWRRFDLVKVKLRSNDRDECEDHDETTEDDTKEDDVAERARKRREFPEDVLGDGSEAIREAKTAIEKSANVLREIQETVSMKTPPPPRKPLPEVPKSTRKEIRVVIGPSMPIILHFII
eukprot:GHVO01058196.1.p1 GENE.GHVO01058196.1~~GHVO01058196.1.p1  ORF type:complete len:193 (-),score=26.47 GHVO01058196.1:339-917(-)